ncbi:MAG: hypothetical protein JRJ46_07780 [Deltaproteobacteria bacterium]|nr:hypothetical protein [Deltaproteobacteria bacterium]
MWQLLNSDMEFLVESDFIYLPLLLDPEIEKEVQALLRPGRPTENPVHPESKTIITHQDRQFVKALSIHSVLENYEVINAYDYKLRRKEFLKKYQLTREGDGILLDDTLKTILFQVMPYFVRKNRGLQRKKLRDEDMLDLIGEKIHIPGKYYKKAKIFRHVEHLKAVLKGLENQKPTFKPPGNGRLSTHQLRDWFHEAVQAKILAKEHDRLTKALQIRLQFSQAKPEHAATLLYIADKGSMEIDGFGFARKNAYRGEYYVYKRIGEYVLKDYYARSYLFPDCRVAVSTYMPFRPFVMEKYKHPFLLRHKSGQEICMKHFAPPDELTADNAIRLLEEGLTALRYGYDARRRNGYHTLERTWVYIPTIDFEDYRI